MPSNYTFLPLSTKRWKQNIKINDNIINTPIPTPQFIKDNLVTLATVPLNTLVIFKYGEGSHNKYLFMLAGRNEII